MGTADAKPTDLGELCERTPSEEQRVVFEDYEQGLYGLEIAEPVKFEALDFNSTGQIFKASIKQPLAVGGSFETPTVRKYNKTVRKALKRFGEPSFNDGVFLAWDTSSALLWIDFSSETMMATCPIESLEK